MYKELLDFNTLEKKTETSEEQRKQDLRWEKKKLLTNKTGLEMKTNKQRIKTGISPSITIILQI